MTWQEATLALVDVCRSNQAKGNLTVEVDVDLLYTLCTQLLAAEQIVTEGARIAEAHKKLLTQVNRGKSLMQHLVRAKTEGRGYDGQAIAEMFTILDELVG